jgi:hypothetical protein
LDDCFTILPCPSHCSNAAWRGIKHPGRDGIEALVTAYDALGTPTAEQVALIKSSSEGRVMPSPYRLEQQKLLAFYEAKRKLDEAISLVNFQP